MVQKSKSFKYFKDSHKAMKITKILMSSHVHTTSELPRVYFRSLQTEQLLRLRNRNYKWGSQGELLVIFALSSA